MTDTIISSATREVVIGFDRPFVIIGERINPTGRKIMAAEMMAGDYSRVIADALAQVEAGAHMLDVNAGIPLADEPGMTLLSPTVELFFGLDSLSPRRRSRAAVDLSLAAPPESGDAETAKEEIRRRNLSILTPQRAARFIEKFLPEKGARISTEHLRITVEDVLLDLLAALAFDRGSSGPAQRSVRWRVHPARADFGTEPERIPRDAHSGRLIERFTLERIS